MVVFAAPVLHSISQRIQLLLGIYQEGYPFGLVEMGIHQPVYSCHEKDFKSLLISGFQNLEPQSKTVYPQLMPSSTFKIKRVGYLFTIRAIFGDLIIYVLGLNMTIQLIGSGLSDHLVQVRDKVECCRSCDHLVPRSQTIQPPASHLEVLQVTTHSQQADPFHWRGEVLLPNRGTVSIFQMTTHLHFIFSDVFWYWIVAVYNLHI